MTRAVISGFKFRLGSTASPPVFENVEEVVSTSGIGQSNPLVEATSFDSTAKEYIAGLADGNEITLTCNWLPPSSPPSVQDDLVAACDAKVNREFQVAYTKVTPEITWTFTVAPLAWDYKPSAASKNEVEFKLKISGPIVKE